LVSIEQLHPSATNPRKHFDKAALAELADSVRSKGILQPLLVRPIGGSGASKAYEVVAGERRYRAAKIAGLRTVPAVVRDMTDSEALELQVIENLHRADLHPLEEAEGYEQLQRLHGYGVDELAAKVLKSKAYVYARLKLLALGPTARKAFYSGALNPSLALLLARIPVLELQDRALHDVSDDDRYRGTMSVREASDLLQRDYMLHLASAPFPRDDGGLLAGAPPCTTCPNRTGNQRELFDDVKNADVCTDPTCFARKREAWQARVRASAEAEGRRVISGKEAKAIKPNEYSSSLRGYVRLGDHCYGDPKGRTYGQLLGKQADAPLLEDPHTKELVPVMASADVTKAIKEKGYSWASQAAASVRSTSSEERRRQEKAKRETEIRRRIHGEIRAKVEQLDAQDLVLVAQAFFGDIWDELRKRIFALWGWEQKKGLGSGRERTGEQLIASLDEKQLPRLLVDLALVKQTQFSVWGGEKADRLMATAKRYGVDVDAIRKAVISEERSKDIRKKKPAKKTKKASS
jgi:ParB/RepB/Spo0J family partition protein